MFAKTRLLLDVVDKQHSPEQLSKIANELKQDLEKINDKAHFIDEITCILERGFESDPSIYLQLIQQLSSASIRCSDDTVITAKETIENFFTQPFILSEKSFTSFRYRIPLMREVLEKRILSWAILKTPLRYLEEENNICYWYLLEIVRLANHLVDYDLSRSIFLVPDDNDEFWCGCVNRLKKAYDNDLVKDVGIEDEMLILFKDLQKKHRWYFSAKGKKHKHHSRKRSKDPTTRETSPSKRSRKCSPTPPKEGLSTQEILSKLMQSPGTLVSATSSMKQVFRGRKDSTTFCDDVLKILGAALTAQSDEAFNSCIKLVKNLSSFEFKSLSSNGQFPVISFRDAVVRSVVPNTRLQSKGEVDRFGESFRVTNELYRLELVPKDLFKCYINALADSDDELSMIVLFKLLANVYNLFLTGIFQITNDEELSFWERQMSRLVAAHICRKIPFDQQTSDDIAVFLKLFQRHGCWRRNRQKKPKSDSISLAGDIDIWLLPFAEKLRLAPTPFEFAEAIGPTLIKIFEEISDDESLEKAGTAISNMCSTNFGRGKRFSFELEHFCLKYLCGGQDKEVNMTLIGKDDLALVESCFFVRRMGCIRLIGWLYRSNKVFTSAYLSVLCDSLLATQTMYSWECLFELLADVGSQMAVNVLENNLGQWWTVFFEEIAVFKNSPTLPQPLKHFATDILLEKSRWPDIGWKKRSLELLSEMVASLTPELRTVFPFKYESTLCNVRNIFARECPDKSLHIQQIVDILLDQIDRQLSPVEEAVASPLFQ